MRTTSLRLRAVQALLIVSFSLIAWAASPRITYERTLPAAHDLGRIDDVAIVSAPANNVQVEAFIEKLMDEINRSRFFRLRDARSTTGPAQAHLAIEMFQCDTAVREREGSARDHDGNRVKQMHSVVDAVCTARVDVLSRTMKRVSTFYAKGEGSSPHVLNVTDEERNDALEDAARRAATEAAARITPRRVRESIPLDETAPSFAEGMAMIDVDRFAEARTIWEGALRKQPRSAPLHFNLAAVCEALGDRRAAELHYVAARQLAPEEPRYANELKLFAQRGLR